MLTVQVLLNNIDSVNRFVAKVGEKDYDVDLISGKYLVNAKSMMGVLSLDLTKPVTLNAETDDESLLDELEEYIAK